MHVRGTGTCTYAIQAHARTRCRHMHVPDACNHSTQKENQPNTLVENRRETGETEHWRARAASLLAYTVQCARGWDARSCCWMGSRILSHDRIAAPRCVALRWRL